MDAITLLKADPDKAESLLVELDSTTERGVKTRTELFARIKAELTVHEVIEEEIFYPELKAHPKKKDIVLEGFKEHHVVDVLMGELEALPVDDEAWVAKATVMKENVEHHIEEEEGGDVPNRAAGVRQGRACGPWRADGRPQGDGEGADRRRVGGARATPVRSCAHRASPTTAFGFMLTADFWFHPCRTGRASSSRWAPWSCSPCSCGAGFGGIEAGRRAARHDRRFLTGPRQVRPAARQPSGGALGRTK